MLAQARLSTPPGRPITAHRAAAAARCHLPRHLPTIARLHRPSKHAGHQLQAISVLALDYGSGGSDGGGDDAGGAEAPSLMDPLPGDGAVGTVPDAEAAALRAEVNTLKDRRG